jgi:hypothetical protein
MLALIIVLLLPSQDIAAPRLGNKFIERHVCEGKCCSFRVAVERRVPIFAGAGAPTTVLEWLAPGDTVLADIDILRWTRIGAIIILRTFKAYDEDAVERTFVDGDTIPLLSYSSEGRYEIWHDNAKRVVMAFWNEEHSWPPLVNPPARLLYHGQSTLWMRVKGAYGARGWIAQSYKLRQLGQVCL